MKNLLPWLIVILLLFFMFFLLLGKIHDQRDFEQMLRAKDDTLKTYRNINGQQVAVISVLHGSVDDLKMLHSKDSVLMRLQKNVTPQTVSAESFDSKTTGVDSGKTVTVHDTIHVHTDSLGIDTCMEYQGTVKTEWDSIAIDVDCESFKVQYTFKNQFDIKQYYKHTGLFKKDLYVDVTSLNPHTETTGLRSFRLSENKTSKWYYLAGGMVMGIIGYKTLK